MHFSHQLERGGRERKTTEREKNDRKKRETDSHESEHLSCSTFRKEDTYDDSNQPESGTVSQRWSWIDEEEYHGDDEDQRMSDSRDGEVV